MLCCAVLHCTALHRGLWRLDWSNLKPPYDFFFWRTPYLLIGVDWRGCIFFTEHKHTHKRDLKNNLASTEKLLSSFFLCARLLFLFLFDGRLSTTHFPQHKHISKEEEEEKGDGSGWLVGWVLITVIETSSRVALLFLKLLLGSRFFFSSYFYYYFLQPVVTSLHRVCGCVTLCRLLLNGIHKTHDDTFFFLLCTVGGRRCKECEECCCTTSWRPRRNHIKTFD